MMQRQRQTKFVWACMRPLASVSNPMGLQMVWINTMVMENKLQMKNLYVHS